MLALLSAGCAGVAPSAAPGAPSPLRGGMSLQAASAAVAVGASTKADVMATLGPADEIRFDTGYEVWVYRRHAEGADPRASPEFVILFAPSGIVKKTRIRPAYVDRG